MSVVLGLSDTSKDVLDRLAFEEEGRHLVYDFYDRMGRDPVGQRLSEKTTAFNALTTAREGLVIVEMVTVIFSLSIAPLFCFNRREKIGRAAVLTAGAAALFVTIGILFDRLHLLPKHREKRLELADFYQRFPRLDEEILAMRAFADSLSEFIKGQRAASKLTQAELEELTSSLAKVLALNVQFSPAL